jgi:SNF2 family DNA or RNA helicase
LVWTSWVNFLRSEGTRFVEFVGRLDMEGKDAAAREFKKNKKTKIMLLSLKAGGVGLNLTVANHVIRVQLRIFVKEPGLIYRLS